MAVFDQIIYFIKKDHKPINFKNLVFNLKGDRN